MNFLNPSGLWFLTLIIPIILLYLLKLRREDFIVSSTYLWQTLIRDQQANAPWQRLRSSLLLILQLMFLFAIVAAILRPYVWREGISSSSLIFIFDTSLSMSASDEQPSRLGEAKRRAFEILDGLPDDTLLTLITAGEQPRTLVSLSRDRSLVRQTIRQLQPEAGGSSLASALQIASAISERQTDPQTVVFAEHWAGLPANLNLKGEIQFVQVGISYANQAVQTLSIQPDFENKNLNAFIQVANFGSASAKRRVVVLADGMPVHAADLEIAAHAENNLVVSGILSSTQVLEARLQPAAIGQDYLSLDDVRYAVVHHPEPVKAALISPGNHFLETALRLMPQVQLEIIAVGDEPDPDTDLVIYDQIVPEFGGLPDTSIFFIAPPQSTSFFTITGKIALPIPTLSEPVDPMVAQIDLNGISILDASRVEIPAWGKTLIVDSVSDDPQPALLFTGDVEGRRLAVLTFSLNRSDLPLNVAFPVLISRLVSWLAPGVSGTLPAELQPGEALSLTPLLASQPTAPHSMIIAHPDGSRTAIDPRQERPVFAETDQPGVYRIVLDGSFISSFAVNLSASSESDIAPTEPPASVVSAAESNPQIASLSQREGWRWAASLALLFLLAEWLTYHRAVLSKLFAQLSARAQNRGLKPK